MNVNIALGFCSTIINWKNLSSFSSFTAHQWKNWSLILSLVCLGGILPDEHLEYWSEFVHNCTASYFLTV